MAQLWRRHTAEFAGVRNPGIRLLPAMLLGVGFVVAVAYFALGLRPRGASDLPELVISVEHDTLGLPDGTTCPLVRHGCDDALRKLPAARLRVVARPEALLAQAAPALAVAASGHRDALLDDGSGPVNVVPTHGDALRTWSELNPDAPGVRLRIVMRSDGFWLAAAAGKVLGSDPRGPTLPPGAGGPDFNGLGKKLAAVKAQLPETEDTCALLPALDTPVGDVVRAATTAHGTFKHVLLAVP